MFDAIRGQEELLVQEESRLAAEVFPPAGPSRPAWPTMLIACPYGRQLAWHPEDSAILVMKNLVAPEGGIFNPCVHQQRESRTPKFRIINHFCAYLVKTMDPFSEKCF